MASEPPTAERRVALTQPRLQWRPLTIVVTLVCGLLAGLIIMGAVGEIYVRRDPAIALAWQPGRAAALAAIAGQQRAAGTLEAANAARITASEALRNNPLEVAAIRELGLAADALGEEDKADALMAIAGSRSLRDMPTQAWLVDRSVRQGRIAEALHRIDALARAAPDVRDSLLPMLVSLADREDTRKPLTEFLASNPPWRTWFLEQLAARAPTPVALLAVLEGLHKAAGAPLPADDLRPYLIRLIDMGLIDQAYLSFIRFFVPPDQLASLGNVYNGNFDDPPSRLPFDWTVRDNGTATAAVVNRGDGTGVNPALLVEFAYGRVMFKDVWQMLALAPGAYRLTGQVRADGLRNERGMYWRVYCLGERRTVIGETERETGTSPWHEFALTFQVPADCRGQLLRLELAARIAREQEVTGRIWYDSIAIHRVEEPPAGQGAMTPVSAAAASPN